MTPELQKIIDRVIKDCKVCQKFKMTVARIRVTLPKASPFNEVVTLDLKEFGIKHLLWMIDRFSRFMVGKLLTNKKAEMIINALMDHWCMNLGYPSFGFFANKGGVFANLQLDELITK